MSDLTEESLTDMEVTEEQLTEQDALFADLGACLRLQSDAVIDAPDWGSFHPQLVTRLDELAEQLDFETENQVLSSYFEEAVSHRAGQWSAFTERVLDHAIRTEKQDLREPVQAQAVRELEADIESTLDEIEPRFENQFYRDLQNRMVAPISPWHRVSSAIRDFFNPPSWAWGSFAVAITAAFLFLSTSGQETVHPLKVSSPNKVQVDAIQFEGTVTLSQSEDLTVIWLAEASG
jgi:hypothetical protein